MRKILIVEDEKMIRQGMAAMVKRAVSDGADITDCRNGLEALEVLEKEPIDIMITDIRMPKMDGLTLIEKMQKLAHVPKTVVVSGYDDFNYAVEVLRYGIKDYLLKPVEREQIQNIIGKLEEELQKEEEKQSVHTKLGIQQLKYYIKQGEVDEEGFIFLKNQFCFEYLSAGYRILLGNFEEKRIEKEQEFILAEQVEGHNLVIAPEEKAEEWAEGFSGCSIGISLVHKGLEEIPDAFLEASQARREAFVKQISSCVFAEGQEEMESFPESFGDEFVQMFGTDRADHAVSQIEGLVLKAKMGKLDSRKMMVLLQETADGVFNQYKNLIEFDMEGYMLLKQPYLLNHMGEYFQVYKEWVKRSREYMAAEFEDYKNKEKINEAVGYIREHYADDLNMAVVSNHISMNYSLFSLTFKQYTGMNFVNYLKDLRITEAKRLLEETDYKIMEISQMVGYENEKHFMKTFKNMCKVSPSEYRKNMQIGKKY